MKPSELDKFRKDLEAAHTAALACDTSGNVQRYGSSTWRTALQSDSNSNDGESGRESDASDSDCGSVCASCCNVYSNI